MDALRGKSGLSRIGRFRKSRLKREEEEELELHKLLGEPRVQEKRLVLYTRVWFNKCSRRVVGSLGYLMECLPAASLIIWRMIIHQIERAVRPGFLKSTRITASSMFDLPERPGSESEMRLMGRPSPLCSRPLLALSAILWIGQCDCLSFPKIGDLTEIFLPFTL